MSAPAAQRKGREQQGWHVVAPGRSAETTPSLISCGGEAHLTPCEGARLLPCGGGVNVIACGGMHLVPCGGVHLIPRGGGASLRPCVGAGRDLLRWRWKPVGVGRVAKGNGETLAIPGRPEEVAGEPATCPLLPHLQNNKGKRVGGAGR